MTPITPRKKSTRSEPEKKADPKTPSPEKMVRGLNCLSRAALPRVPAAAQGSGEAVRVSESPQPAESGLDHGLRQLCRLEWGVWLWDLVVVFRPCRCILREMDQGQRRQHRQLEILQLGHRRNKLHQVPVGLRHHW